MGPTSIRRFSGNGSVPAWHSVSRFRCRGHFLQVRLQRLHMNRTWWSFRLFNHRPATSRLQRIAGSIEIAISLLLMTGVAVAQNPTTTTPLPTPDTPMSVPIGYAIHQTLDLGGRIAKTS